jgi:hypothetical protein
MEGSTRASPKCGRKKAKVGINDHKNTQIAIIKFFLHVITSNHNELNQTRKLDTKNRT